VLLLVLAGNRKSSVLLFLAKIPKYVGVHHTKCNSSLITEIHKTKIMSAPTIKDLLQEAYNAQWIKGVPNSTNCSGFLKSLGSKMKFFVPNSNADGIIGELEEICKTKSLVMLWEKLPDLSAAISAVKDQQRLVIVGATSGDYGATNGHVAILLPVLSGAHKAPLIYGGASSPTARSQGTKTIREVWSPSKHSKLRFFAHRTVKFVYA
jgi:hypothetical protein